MIENVIARPFPRKPAVAILGLLAAILVASLIGLQSAQASDVLHVPNDFNTIQAAVDAASPGDVIRVAPGTYNENVVITTADLRLRGQRDGDEEEEDDDDGDEEGDGGDGNAILDGTGLGGIGIHLLNTSGVRVSGFVVQNFEAGVVLDNIQDSHVSNIEAKYNDSDVASLRGGLQLVNSHDNRVTHVYAHHNGHNGITLKGGSTSNTLRRNTANDNGQNPAVAASFGGCGVQLISSGNHDNIINGNETLRNGWGIQVGAGSNGNRVIRNESHENQRAGVVTLDSATDNVIVRNDATGNGLADVAPSGTFDLFDQGDLNNIWRNNQGSSNF
ncbi:MAG: right-handed parallel beta-helix repeat-containing protein [Chloroflexi bacterium]|nr:right-handed parallel beta-helix repeat-containing protein [Chloroflexota bacterium]